MAADFESRIIIVTGHYGSGKTEFAVSLAMRLAEQECGGRFSKLAVVDLDIVNPYFRSRERREILEEAGVSVYGSVFRTEVAAELPALGADTRAPLEDSGCRVIIDGGGNDAGALVLNQFSKYFTPEESAVLAVVNANRPDTGTLNGALEHIAAIEAATGLRVTGIVNNTHMLRETTAADVLKGRELCLEICGVKGSRLMCDCYPAGIVHEDELTDVTDKPMPLGLYMRPTWLDR